MMYALTKAKAVIEKIQEQGFEVKLEKRRRL